MVHEVGVLTPGSEQFRAVGAGGGHGRIDDARADEDVDKRLLVGVVRRSEFLRQVVLDAEDCKLPIVRLRGLERELKSFTYVL